MGIMQQPLITIYCQNKWIYMEWKYKNYLSSYNNITKCE